MHVLKCLMWCSYRENDKKAKQLLMSVSESVARLPTGANSANGYNTNMGKRRPQKKSKKKRSKSNYTRARGPSHYKRNPFTSSDSLAPRKGMEIDFSFDNVVLFIVASMPAMVTVGLVVLRWWSPVPPWTVISIRYVLCIPNTSDRCIFEYDVNVNVMFICLCI